MPQAFICGQTVFYAYHRAGHYYIIIIMTKQFGLRQEILFS